MANITNILKELRRRSIFKVGGVYAVVAWLLLQIAAVTFPALYLPNWSLTLVTVIVILGFPLALIVAWGHGMTSLDNTVDPNSESAPESEKSNNNLSPVIQQNESGKFSIVVLPFELISKDTQDEGFSDGITTELINALGHTDIFDVASSHSAFNYKGQNKDAREIGQELNVKFVLEGSLRVAGNHARIAVALIDALSNHQVWAESYDREISDQLEIESELGRTITETLGSVLWRASMDETKRSRSQALDVPTFIDRSNSIFFNYSQRSFAEGKELIEIFNSQSTKHGHGYALHSFLLAHEMVDYWSDNPKDTLTQALQAADSAIELGRTDAWVLGLTSEALVWIGEAQKAVTLSERAVAIAPDNFIDQTRARYGHALLHVDRGEEGLIQIERAIAASPSEHFTPPWHYLFRCWAYMHLERYEEAKLDGQKAVELHYANSACLFPYANALAMTGHLDEAQASLAELKILSPKLSMEHIEWAYRIGYLKEDIAERHICGLRKLNWD